LSAPDGSAHDLCTFSAQGQLSPNKSNQQTKHDTMEQLFSKEKKQNIKHIFEIKQKANCLRPSGRQPTQLAQYMKHI
jgi:hypothetical protein